MRSRTTTAPARAKKSRSRTTQPAAPAAPSKTPTPASTEPTPAPPGSDPSARLLARIGLTEPSSSTPLGKYPIADLLARGFETCEADLCESMLLGIRDDLAMVQMALESKVIVMTDEQLQSALWKAQTRTEIAADLHGRMLKAAKAVEQ